MNNVETMLSNREIIVDAKERKFSRRVEKANEKELKYEMNPYNWNRVKLPNGSIKVNSIDDKNENGDWGKDENDLVKPPLVKIVDERHKIIDKLKNREGVPELIWKHCTFTKAEYIARQEEEVRMFKVYRKREIRVKTKEIFIPKLLFNEQEMKAWSIKKGAIFKEEASSITNDMHKKRIEEYFPNP
jgi:hypothetical protein